MFDSKYFFSPSRPFPREPKAGTISLNNKTPRGLFSGQPARYLVCDGLDHRFAVILDTYEELPFTYLPLGNKPISRGYWERFLGIKLGEPLSPASDEPKVGLMKVEENSIKLGVRSPDGACFWATIFQGRSDGPEGLFDRWSISTDDISFFGLPWSLDENAV